MSRNALYLVISMFTVAAVIAGYLYYQEQQRSAGIQIKVGDGSLTIETK